METSTRAVLIVHGLTATPATMAPTMEAMEDAGYAVSAPMLPGHGTTVADLEHATWQDWVACVHAAYDILAAQYDHIYYIGLSLGALLGLEFAAGNPAKLRAMALLGTPLQLSPVIRTLVPLVRYSPVRWIFTSSAKDWEHSIADPDGRTVYQESSYDRMPIAAVYQLYDLQHKVRAELPQIHTPTLLIHSHQDDTAPPDNVPELCAAIHTPDPEVLWLDNSKHVLTLDVDRDKMNAAILHFFQKDNA